jgi:hypothetical protein
MADHHPKRATLHPDGAPLNRIFDLIGDLPTTD